MYNPQTLRPYQVQAVEAAERAWLMNESPLMFIATGGGKTTIMAELLRRNLSPQRQRALVFVHRLEIVEQIHDRIMGQCFTSWSHFTIVPGAGIYPSYGISMGAQNADNARVVVASAASLHAKRLPKLLEHGAFDYVIIDEAHHYAPGNSFNKILDGCREANPALKLIGFTATPKRHDKKSLGHGFTKIAFEWSILDGIKGGFLVPVQRVAVQTKVNASDIKTTAGDYDQGRLVSVLETSNWIELAINAYRQYIEPEDRLTMAFFPAVKMSEAFAEAARAAGIAAAHVDGETPAGERAQILADFRAGRLRLVSNVGVLTEGVDVPEASAILLGRPTRSEGLFTQMVGRILRIAEGKKDGVIVDLTVLDSKALDIGTLLGKMEKCEHCGREYHKGLFFCPHCGLAPTPKEKEERAERDGIGKDAPSGVGLGFKDQLVSIFASTSAAWHRDADNYMSVSLGQRAGAFVIVPPSYGANANRLIERLGEATYHLKRLRGEGKKTALLEAKIGKLERELERIDRWQLYRLHTDSTVEYLRGAESLAKLMIEADIEAMSLVEDKKQIKRDADWRLVFPSMKQLEFLKRLKIEYDPQTLTKGIASELIQHATAVPKVKAWIVADILPDPKIESSVAPVYNYL